MKTPIHRAIAEVLKSSPEPMAPRAIYQAIAERNLYPFKAKDPLHVVKDQLRRHTRELDFPSARSVKYFTMTRNGRFALLEEPILRDPDLFKVPGRGGKHHPAVVTVPSQDDHIAEAQPDDPSHSEIQWRLLDLGCQMGLSVWAPMADRGKTWNGGSVGSVSRLLNKLPRQFDQATMKTIENIDVLWLDKSAIVAGFEVEHTSVIYSGLLRMADLLTMQPNLSIKLYLVAPDERFGKFAREVARPTFSSLRKPLHSTCSFLPYTSLLERLEEARNLLRHLRPEFLDDVAESYDPAAEIDN